MKQKSPPAGAVLTAALLCAASMSARETIFSETFQSVNGQVSDYAAATSSSFDNQGDWQLSLAYEGDHCISLNTGGKITLPPIPDLTGNAVIEVTCGPHSVERNNNLWGFTPETATEQDWLNYESSMIQPHILSLSEGNLSTAEVSEMMSMSDILMWDVTPATRITLTASHPVDIASVKVSYGSSYQGGGDPGTNNFVVYSHEEKEYPAPISVTLTYKNMPPHAILLYTLDGTTPVRTSPRYAGPIDITATTTITPAYINQSGDIKTGNTATFSIAGGESTPQIPENVITLDIPAPGKLTDLVLDLDVAKIEGLKINGKLNSTDLAYIVSGRRLADLTYLDLSGITLEYDDGVYYDETGSVQPGLFSQQRFILSETNSYDESYRLDRTIFTYYSNSLGGLLYGKESIKTVIWPESLSSVGVYALASCNNLSYFGSHDALTEVDENAFAGCMSLGNYKWIEGLTTFGRGAFAYAKVGYNMEFAKENTVFGRDAFLGSNIRDAKIVHPQDTLPENLFKDSELETIIIGEGCTVLDHGSLYASNLTNVTLPSSLQDIAGMSQTRESAFYPSCPYIINIPEEDGIRYIMTIAYDAPDNQKDSYTVKHGTTKLSDGLFLYHYINSIQLPETLTSIGKNCFAYSALKSIDLPESIRYIGDGAFDCCALETLTIPENVEFIGTGIVQNCGTLWNVTYNAIHAEGTDVLVWTNQGLNANTFERINIGDKVKRIPSGIFTNNWNIKEVKLPSSVETIDTQAFFYCKALQSMDIPDNVTTIGDEAFYGCDKLTEFHWPLNLKTIGGHAFRNCRLLKNISMPEGVTSVGNMTFLDCRAVERVYIPSTISEIGEAAFEFSNKNVNTIITCAASTPPEYQWNKAYSFAKAVKVPAASLQAYWDSPYWKIFINVIQPIEEIQPITEETTTSFSNVSDEMDLSDGYIGDIYVSLGEDDSYDAAEGCIVLGSTMSKDEADAVGGLVPGKSDISNRFDGLIVMVEAGHGTVKVDCQTIGGNLINVKIGDNNPALFAKDIKGTIEVDYDVDDTTCIYIFGSSDESAAAKSRAAESGCVKIYSITVNPISAGINDVTSDGFDSPIESHFTVGGQKIEHPTLPGVYIIKRQDGTTSKVLIK